MGAAPRVPFQAAWPRGGPERARMQLTQTSALRSKKGKSTHKALHVTPGFVGTKVADAVTSWRGDGRTDKAPSFLAKFQLRAAPGGSSESLPPSG